MPYSLEDRVLLAAVLALGGRGGAKLLDYLSGERARRLMDSARKRVALPSRTRAALLARELKGLDRSGKVKRHNLDLLLSREPGSVRAAILSLLPPHEARAMARKFDAKEADVGSHGDLLLKEEVRTHLMDLLEREVPR